MYLTRTNVYNSRYIEGTYPSILIDDPCPQEKVNYNNLRIKVITRACYLGCDQYHFELFLGKDQYNGKYYKDGYIDIKQKLQPGSLNIRVKLYQKSCLVDEDSVCVIIYNPDYQKGPCRKIEVSKQPCSVYTEPSGGPCSSPKKGPCNPVCAQKNGPCNPVWAPKNGP